MTVAGRGSAAGDQVCRRSCFLSRSMASRSSSQSASIRPHAVDDTRG